MPKVYRGKRKRVRRVRSGGYPKRPVIQREREEPDMPPVPRAPGRRRPGEQTKPTRPHPSEAPRPSPREGPADDHRAVVFKGYTPLDTSKLSNVTLPVDPCGAASENGVVAMTGNVYLAVSIDDGASFKYSREPQRAVPPSCAAHTRPAATAPVNAGGACFMAPSLRLATERFVSPLPRPPM
jgi:hypothetical protein